MDIVNEVKNFVEAECKNPGSKYGYEPFTFHFITMLVYAKALAKELKADEEIVLLSVWLHDIGSIIHGRDNHHVTGASIAEKMLKELGYPSEKIERVKKCILNHRGSEKNERKSIEEQIVSDADALSNFDNVPGIFKAAFIYENKNQSEAKDSVKEKLERKWQQLHFESSKKLIKEKYQAVQLLFK